MLITAAAVQTGALAMGSRLAAPSPRKSAIAPRACVPEHPESWDAAAFERLRGSCFLVDGQELLLDQVEGRSCDGLDTVSLRFSGPACRPLESQLHRFRHPAHAALDLFVVPGSTSTDTQLYRVTICRLAPEHSNRLSPREGLSLPAGAKGPRTTPV